MHYRANDNRYRRDIALAREAGTHLLDDINDQSQAAAAARNDLANDVWDHV